MKEAAITSQLWAFFAMVFCLGFCAYAVMVHIVPHAIELGISTAHVANILAALGGLTVAGRVVMGIAADNIGNEKTFIIGFILMAVALFLIVPAREKWMLYFISGMFGFSFGAAGAVVPSLIAELFGLNSHGEILGLISAGYSIGSAGGPFVMGYAFDLTQSYETAFLLCAAVTIAGLLWAAILKAPRRT